MTKYAIGIDIGGSNFRAALISSKELIASEIISEPIPKNIHSLKIEIDKAVKTNLIKNGSECEAIGIGIPGLVSEKSKRIVKCPNLDFLSDKPMSILDCFKQPVFIGNDVDMALIAERFQHKEDNLLLLNIGTGIGSAFYLKERGSWELDLAGEFGHQKVLFNGKKCGCGGFGCIESYFSGKAIFNEAKKMGLPVKDSRGVFDLARAKNKKAEKIISDASEILGIGIANVVNLLGIEKIIFGGKLSNSFDLFEKSMVRSMKKNVFAMDARKISIERSELVDRSTLLGAGLYALEKSNA